MRYTRFRVLSPDEARPARIQLTDSESTLPRVKPLRADVDVVLVPVTVTDPMNRPVLGLQKQDFKVYEDNAPQQVQYFSAEEAPISVGLLLDTSKSMANKFVTERAAAEEFFKNANPQDDYFVITFADQPRLLTTSIQSIEDMQETLTSDTPDGHTALLDAIYLAIARMRSARYERRALADHLRRRRQPQPLRPEGGTQAGGRGECGRLRHRHIRQHVFPVIRGIDGQALAGERSPT